MTFTREQIEEFYREHYIPDALEAENKRLRAELATAHELLREWRATELDSMDEEFQPWIDQFTARVDVALKGAK